MRRPDTVCQQQLRAVLAVAPVVLWTLDHERRVTELTGSPMQRVDASWALGKRFDDLWGSILVHVAGEGPMSSSAVIERVFAGEELVGTSQTYDRTFETRYVPLRGRDGSVCGAIGVAIEVAPAKP